MSGPTSFRLSQETFELLKKNRDFYESLFDLQKKKETPLLPKATDAESRTESVLRDNGDVEVSLVLPVDDDANPANGRLYVRDTFVFDPSERVLKSYRRSFEHNGKGGDEWKGWLGKYQALPDSSGRAATDPVVQKFAHRVARSYGRPIVDDAANTLPEIRGAFKKEGRLLATTNQQVLDLKAGLDFKIKDKLNYYNLSWRNGKLEVALQLSVDDDAEADNGRILLRDKFRLDAETLAFEGFERSWALAPGSEGDARLQAALRALQAKPDPSAEEASAFIQALLPAILPKGEPDASAVLALLGAGKTLPKDYASPFARRGKGDPEGLKAAAQSSLEAMYVVAQEQVMKRHDESQGWLHFGASVDQAKEKGLVETLFQKAKVASEKSPGRSPFELFRGLELDGDAAALRDRLLGDALMAELDDLAREPDAALRGKSLAILAQQKLLVERGMGESAMFLAEHLKKDPATRRVGEDILAVVQGKGDFGQKVGYVLPLFCQEVSKPSMLLGMAAAPFMGTAFELGGLKLAKWAYDAKKVSDIGRGAKLGAAVLGMGGEALGFTAIHRGFERLHHGGDKAWNGAWQEIVSATLMFGGMRLTHWGSGAATARMAEGAWGSRFGYRFGEAEFAGGLGRSPTGRFFFDAAAPMAGKGIPTLTTSGKAVSGAMNHLGGILTMQASGALSRKLGLMPDNQQSFGANFFDATVMYAQAMVGSHAANMVSGGSLHRSLGEFKMGVENLKKGIPVAPSSPPAAPDSGAATKPDAASTPSQPPAAAAPASPDAPPASAAKPGFLERLRARKSTSSDAKIPVAAPPAPAKPEAKAETPQKSGLFERLFAGREGAVKNAFEAAREWWSNLSPAKAKALQAELAEARAKLAAAEKGGAEQGKAIVALEAEIAGLKTQNEAARQELEAKQGELEGLKSGLAETEGKQRDAERLAGEKAQALAAAETRLRELEAQKAEAEQKLQNYVEKAELSELDLGVGSLEQQIEAHKAELGKLRAEKRDAEVQADAHKLAAEGLRQRLGQAEAELERRKHVDQALRESESHAEELGARITELRGALEELQKQTGELSKQSEGAARLTSDQARRISELERLKSEAEGKLEKALSELTELRKDVAARDAGLKELKDNLEDIEAQLASANHRIEAQERSIEHLGKVKQSLEGQKETVEKELAEERGEKSEIQGRLDDTAAKLKEVNRELSAAKHELEITNAGKKAAQEEASRLRERLTEGQKLREESEGKLRQGIRDLENQLREQAKLLEASQKEASELGERLAQQTLRAESAEGRETDLQQRHAALEAELASTQAELAKAQKKAETLGRELESKKNEIERQKTNLATLQRTIEGLRSKKTELEESLRQLRVENTMLGKDLETVRAELAAEKSKEPELIEDVTRIAELEEKIAELEGQKERNETRLSELEGSKAGLESKVSELDTAKSALEKQVRSMETDLEIAKGAAKSAAEDLQTLRDRATAEEARLKKSVEEWRKRATDAESGKAAAEAKIQELGREITEKRGRIEALERESADKSAELKTAENQRAVLEGDVTRLEGELAEQQRLLELKRAELDRTQRELGERIEALEGEKLEQARQIGTKTAEVSRLTSELEALGKRLAAVELELSGTKSAAEKQIGELTAERTKLRKEIETKESELRQKNSDLINSRARVEELEADLQGATQSLAGERQAFEAEKARLEGILAAKETALAEGRSALETAQSEARTLGERLETTRRELEAEQAAAKDWKRKFEGLEATSKAEAGRLRREAEELRKQEGEAVRKASDAVAKAESLEAALQELGRQKDESEGALSRKLGVAEQKAAREESRALEAKEELEGAKAAHAAEAERLRQEAVTAGKQAALSEAKARELEAALDVERAKIRELDGDLAAARAEVEALLAPASLRAEAEQKALDAGRKSHQLQESLRAAEQGKAAAEQRVLALEKELSALRSGSESEAETLRTEAAAHSARAEAAEERARASGLRIIALEAEVEALRIEAAALRSDAEGRAEAEATVAGLRDEIAGLRAMVQEAELRATQAERRAVEFEEALTASEQGAAEAARNLSELQGQKAGVDRELKALREKLEGTEAKLTEAVAKRKKAEGELLGVRTRVADLEQQLEIKTGELATKTQELTAARSETTRIWTESQAAGREAQRRLGAMEEELSVLRNAKEGLDEQLEIEQGKVRDVERTLELMVAGEEALRKEIESLKGERNAANVRSRELESALAAKQTEIAGLNVALENQQPGGFRYPHYLFSGIDPRSNRVETRIQATALIGDAADRVVGEAHIVAGGEEGLMKLQFADGSRAAGRTSIGNVQNGGNGKRKFQEDGIYLSRFLLPDGTEVKILAGADGAGGMGSPGSGAVASSAFLQGVHARVSEAAREGRVPNAQELFEAGVTAVEIQRNQPDRRGMEDATGAGAVIVVVGNEAMVASAGDASVLLARPDADGRYEILGYSNVGIIPIPRDSGQWAYNNLERGIHQYGPSLYRISDLKPGDRFLIGSDGFHENTTGVAYKQHGSRETRRFQGFRPPTQDVFAALRAAFKATRGQVDSASKLHDLALENIRQPGRKIELEGEEIQLPQVADKDNIFVIDYEHGGAAAAPYEIPINYSPLEPVPTAEQIRAAEAAAERSTAKGFKVPAPEAAGDPGHRPRISDRTIADFHLKYVDDLGQLYGAAADKASQRMLALYLAFPEIEEVFNPSLLARAEDKPQQTSLFDAAKKKIEARKEIGPEVLKEALGELEKIKQVQRSYRPPEAADVQRILDAHGATLARIFGEGAREAAEVYAGIFKNFPQLEEAIGPGALAKQSPADFEKFFKRKIRPGLHRDKFRLNEETAADSAFTASERLNDLHKAAADYRRMSGWTTANAVENGLREWSLDTATEYVIGKNGEANVRIPDQGVSRKHFKLYARVNRWVLEDVGSTYGTFVNGQQVQRAQLKSGDRIQVGVDVELQLQIDGQTGAARMVELPKKPGAGLPGQAEAIPVGDGAVGFKIPRGRPVVLGRKQIPDSGLSPDHFEILHKGDGWMIRDMGSDTGTQLNGVDIQKGVDPATQKRTLGVFHPIKDGALITVGGLTFRFHESADHATLIQVAGQAVPPSSHFPRAAAPVARMALQEGASYKFNNPAGEEVAEIFWDGFDHGGGEFVLREITRHGQVWILNGNNSEPLSGHAYAMADGLTFGFGPRPDRAQWYYFKDGVVTAVQPGRHPRASTEPMPSPAEGALIEFPAGAQPIKLGRKELGGHSNISNQHLAFIFHEKAWWVKDLGSSNGTYQNNQLISKGKGQEGDWVRVNPNDILGLGGVHFVFRLRADGGMRLEQIVAAPAAAAPDPVSVPPAYMPPRTSQSYGPPSISGTDMNFGWARVIRIVENRGETGLQPATTEESSPSEYFLNISKGGFFKSFFEKDLARIEDLGEGRYRVENIGFKQGLAITNPAKGKNIPVALGRSDQALAGDTLEFNGHKVTLKP